MLQWLRQAHSICQSSAWNQGFLTLVKGVGSHFQTSWCLGELFHPPTFSAACPSPLPLPIHIPQPSPRIPHLLGLHPSWVGDGAYFILALFLIPSWTYRKLPFLPSQPSPLVMSLGRWTTPPWRPHWLDWGSDFSGASGCYWVRSWEWGCRQLKTEHWARKQDHWACILALLWSFFMSLSKSYNLLGPLCLCLWSDVQQ